MNTSYTLGKLTKKAGKWGVMLPAAVVAGTAYGLYKGAKKLAFGTAATGLVAGTAAYQTAKEVVKTPVDTTKSFFEEYSVKNNEVIN